MNEDKVKEIIEKMFTKGELFVDIDIEETDEVNLISFTVSVENNSGVVLQKSTKYLDVSG